LASYNFLIQAFGTDARSCGLLLHDLGNCAPLLADSPRCAPLLADSSRCARAHSRSPFSSSVREHARGSSRHARRRKIPGFLEENPTRKTSEKNPRLPREDLPPPCANGFLSFILSFRPLRQQNQNQPQLDHFAVLLFFRRIHTAFNITIGGVFIYFSFFLGRSWLEWPHFFLRQLIARGGRRA